MGSNDRKKAELTAQLQILRGELSGDFENLGVRLNVVQRFQNSFAKNQRKWLIGSVIVGAALVFSSPRRSSRKKEPGMGNSFVKSLLLGLLTKTTKQIIRQSVPSLAKYVQKEIEQQILREPGNARSTERQHETDKPENL